MTAWTAIVGAARYAAAVAAGDVAGDEAKALRIAQCRTCLSLTVHRVPLLGCYAAFCGTPFQEGPGACGCLVASAPAVPTDGDEQVIRLRVLAALTPAGKACCGSEACPSGRWDADAPWANPPS